MCRVRGVRYRVKEGLGAELKGSRCRVEGGLYAELKGKSAEVKRESVPS